MLMNIPDNIKKPRGLCKPLRSHRVASGLFCRQQKRDSVLARSLQEALWAPQFWNADILVPAELWWDFHLKLGSKIPNKGWLPQSKSWKPSVPATSEVGPKGNEFRDPSYAMTKPQKAGTWKKVTRLEASTQGTTVTGARGPIVGLADRKRASVMPQSRSWKTTALWQSRPSGVKEQIIRKETTFSKPKQTS